VQSSSDNLDHKHSAPVAPAVANVVQPSAASAARSDPAPTSEPEPELAMARQLREIIDATLTAELALHHPAAQSWAKTHGRQHGLTETELQIIEHGAVCTNVVNGVTCGGVMVAPESRVAKLRCGAVTCLRTFLVV
jgi:hypothetical protein